MPELPEVETVVRGLRLSLPGRAIVEVRFGKTDFVEDPAAIAERLPGMRISDVTRRGKFIFIGLEAGAPGVATAVLASSFYLIIHLGMTGQLKVMRSGESVAPHTHVFFVLDDGRELRYTDIRRFGRMLVMPESGLAEFTGQLGIEPLEISAEEFCRYFRSRRTRVKALLLDQRVLRGIGNIYADESLFRARLHPARIAENLTERQLVALHAAVRQVLEEAIRSRGSSVSDYVDSDGNRGEFQLRHRVYQRDGKPCLRCKTKIRRVIVAGRSSHFCPRCQPVPRARKKRLEPQMNTEKHGLKTKRMTAGKVG
ncbi:MAG TPA: bifunctional DNA-formamidopyrimidine glycosylase/DNA-(apurinic or apyrimidinic site) lyase [Candidatus Acidoferrales bacterium]|jgi:formamidopyrimidine-DNA glycosylase|nr:bifunctional DNA-formamidopyrimidine glycosylase/DNA-(apurinic or apyrimidinic site) lyase [Candidatus Acidoferrales bacterium]